MAQLVVRNLEDEVKSPGRSCAPGVTAAAPRRKCARSCVTPSKMRVLEGTPLGKRLRAKKKKKRFAGIGLEEDLPELRGQIAQPADFEK